MAYTTDEYVETVEYSHTEIDIAYDSVNLWNHPRDHRDAQEGREDVGPVESPIADAITDWWAESEAILELTHHINIRRTGRITSIPDDITVTVE
jgi:hypothetical protein